MRYLLFAAFVGTVFGANWAIQTFGLVPVGFGLMAPAGVYFVGLSFTLRDLLHKQAGRYWTLGAVAVGAALSAFLGADAPRIALASGVAFLASEIADLAVYEPMLKRGWLKAVALSNVAGLVVDSSLFLYLAFGSLDFIAGQIVGKGWMTALAIGALWSVNRAVSQRENPAEVGSPAPRVDGDA